MSARSRRGRRRAPNLSDGDIKAIVQLLDGWQGRLSWDGLLDAVEGRFHWRYTRQTLFKHARIRDGFRMRKEAQREHTSEERRAGSAEMQAALGHLQRVEAENQRLEAENERLLEQFSRWAYNARMRGLDEEALNQPLPPIDRAPLRGRTGRKKRTR